MCSLPTKPSNSYLGAKDTSIMIWDSQTHQRLATLTGHREPVVMLRAFDDYLVSGSSDGGVRVWDITNNSFIHALAVQDRSVMFCGMNEDRTLLATGGVEGEVKIWNMETG